MFASCCDMLSIHYGNFTILTRKSRISAEIEELFRDAIVKKSVAYKTREFLDPS